MTRSRLGFSFLFRSLARLNQKRALFLALIFDGQRMNSLCQSTTSGDQEIVNKMQSAPFGPLRRFSVAVVLCLLAAGCSSPRTPVNEKEVVPVSGVVHVDGQPVAGIKISFHADEKETSHRIFPKATTDVDGKFQAWSYRKDDGLAAGDYTITFIDHSGRTQPFQRESEKPDLFKGKYSDLKKSEFRLAVPAGSDPIDMGVIELTRP
ncbi:hypothetical protein Mal52_50870 [Symmachiella dynata]|uniref:Nickel uptake substrate-specific transmembrane region n=1 Tax=Symmachiella dynata TaxID=2527995 RepID=A0A517ZVV5_9PLAN|nr:hypothetical protein [Symmachiella dynata]QDU46566.1 hypothetical protein Mal52_50870 [Symmachiella dynata]